MQRAGWIVAVLLVAGVVARAQTQVPGAFRSAVTLVPIDVRVIDRDGRAVTDLTQTDFTILEDDVRQDIAYFSRQALVPEPTAAGPQAGPTLRGAGSDLAPQDHRIFLIVLGRGRLREPAHAMEALLSFVRHRLLPQDQVALFAWNRATDFTTDHEKVAQVLERFDRAHETIEGRLAFHFSSLAAAYGSKEIPREIQDDIDRVFGTGAGRTGAKDALPARHLPPGGVSESARLDAERRQVVADLLSSGNNAMTDLPFEEFVSENARTLQDLGNLYAGIEYLRFLDGEKHLLLVTEKGLFLPRAEDDERIARAANTARVVIDTIETGGLWVGQSESATRGGPNPGQWTQTWAFSALRTMARLTGGQASICEWSRVAVDRIDDSTRAGYLLGYYPKNTTWDGRYRNIVVRVSRPGLTLLYRHGYEASDRLVPFDRRAFLAFARIMTAAQYSADVRDIRLSATTRRLEKRARRGESEPAATTLQVNVRIDASRVKFEDVGSRGEAAAGRGRHVAGLDVAVLVIDSDGRIAVDRWQKIDLDLDDVAYVKCRRDGIPYSVSIPVIGAGGQVKVVVYDYAGDALGSTTARVF